MKKIKVFIVDDHAIVRSGIKSYLGGGAGCMVAGEAASAEEALELLTRKPADVVLADISLPGMDGIAFTRELRKTLPSVPVLIMTVHTEEEFIRQALNAGASGYLLKDAEKDDLIAAVSAVAGGERYFGENVSKIVFDRFAGAKGAERPHGGAGGSLTRRETEVLRCIAEGMNNAAIAAALFISPLTVHTHRNNLMRKLDIHDAAGLVRFAMVRFAAGPDESAGRPRLLQTE